MASTLKLNVSNWRSGAIPVPSAAHRVAVQIEPDSTNGWGTAVVTMQYKIDDEEVGKDNTVTWQGFDTAVTFSSTNAAERKVSVTGATHISFKTTTADGAASPTAEYTVIFA
jgi:hypothetical protein